jgi:glycosyltransferase involved in cell wall biosynthesis
MRSKLKDKRVLLLVSTDVTYDQRVYRTARSLSDLGAKVTLIGRNLPDSSPVEWPGIRIERVSLSVQSGPSMYILMNQKMIVQAAAVHRWDIVVSNDFDTLLAGYRISRKNKSAWILDAHEHFIEVPELKGREIKRSLWHALGLWAAPRLDAAYTVSESLGRILSGTYNIPFSIIENRPLYRSMKTTYKTIPKLLFYQGALNRGRGLDTAILAMRDMPNYKLHMAGDGDIKGELEALIRRYHLEDRVELLGRIPPKKLDFYTAKAWLGLNLLEGEGLNYYYSLANKFFDYAQWGVPSINPAFPEYLKYKNKYGGCLLLDKLSPSNIKSAVFSLEDDPAAYANLRKGALKMKEACHWETQVPKLEKIYSTVV